MDALKPRKLPRQIRAQQTVIRILDSAAHILIEEGVERLTTNYVAESANISVGSLYQYFPNKQSIIAELRRKHLERLRHAMLPVINDAKTMPLAEAIRYLVETSVKIHQIDFELNSALDVTEQPMPKNAVYQERSPIIYGLQEFLTHRKKELRSDLDPEFAALTLFQAVKAILHGTAEMCPDRLYEKVLVQEITSFVIAYTIAPSAKPEGDRGRLIEQSYPMAPIV